MAIQKAVEDAKKNLFRVPKYRTTITHQVLGRSGAGKVFLKPASEGTGVIAGGGVRAVLELAGIRDILSKSLGTSNPVNLVAATVAGPQGPAPARGGRRAARQDRRRGARALVRLRRAGHRGRRRRPPRPRSPDDAVSPSPRCARRSAPSRATAAPSAPSACAGSGRPSSTRTRPSSRGCSAGSPGSSAWRRPMPEQPRDPRDRPRGRPPRQARPRARAPSARASASAAASGRAPARRRAAARRASAPAPAAASAPATRAARCRSTCSRASSAAPTARCRCRWARSAPTRCRSTSARLTVFDAGTTVDPEALAAKGLVKNNANRDWPVKILAGGEIDRALTVRVHAVSARGAGEDRGGRRHRRAHRRGRRRPTRRGRRAGAQDDPDLAPLRRPAEEAGLHRLHPAGLPLRVVRARCRASTSTPSRRRSTQRGSRLLDFLNLFAGGALTRFAVFALGIMPYITASIILQLMTVVIPRLEALQKEGESGQQKITQYTRYFTVVLALLQSMAYVLYFKLAGRAARVQPRPLLPDRHLGDGGHRAADVARRADHPARRRQRHLAADLRQHRLVGPRRGGRLADAAAGLAGADRC